MGALHEGHLALVRAARAACASVVASVFVNPAQFGPGEDFDRYPRDEAGDRAKLQAAGVDAVYVPSREHMYPPGFVTFVDVGDLGTRYEGAVRPGHFRGVATIVAKLLNLVQPDVLYLGQKDAQQTAVLRAMLRDLNFGVRLEIVPTVRERDGLALSSRNGYLSPEERAAAPSLYAALQAMLAALQAGANTSAAREQARAALAPGARMEYFDLVEERSFTPLERLGAPAFVIGAARFGTTRLIDNLMVPGSA